MQLDTIDDRFSVTAQIRPEQVAEMAALGFRTIVCARPDAEEAGQPAFAAIAAEAERHGMTAIHVPMTGVAPSAGQAALLHQAMQGAQGAAVGYCRSGTRARNLYAAAFL